MDTIWSLYGALLGPPRVRRPFGKCGPLPAMPRGQVMGARIALISIYNVVKQAYKSTDARLGRARRGTPPQVPPDGSVASSPARESV